MREDAQRDAGGCRRVGGCRRTCRRTREDVRRDAGGQGDAGGDRGMREERAMGADVQGGLWSAGGQREPRWARVSAAGAALLSSALAFPWGL